MRTSGTLAVLGFTLVFGTSLACAQDTVRVRGTVDKVEGETLSVKARDGQELKLTPAPNATYSAVVKASLDDVKPGKFVGVTAMPQADGSQKAVEVHIFPEAMRGTGEGHYAWDLQPKSTMTNASVEQSVEAVNGQTLTLKYKDGQKDITVPPDATIVTYEPGNKADIKPGTKVFVAAAKRQPDGSLQAPRISYGKDGITPPM